VGQASPLIAEVDSWSIYIFYSEVSNTRCTSDDCDTRVILSKESNTSGYKTMNCSC